MNNQVCNTYIVGYRYHSGDFDLYQDSFTLYPEDAKAFMDEKSSNGAMDFDYQVFIISGNSIKPFGSMVCGQVEC